MEERERDTSGRFTGEVTGDDVVAAVRAHDPAATSEVADAVGVSRQAVDRRLRRLRDDGRVSSKKIGASLVWFTPRTREADERPAHGDADGLDVDDLQGDASATLADDADAHSGESDGVELGDDIPAGVDVDAARDAIRAAVSFLEHDGPASTRKIVAAVMSDHALGYDVPELEPGDRFRGAWWRRVVRPALDTHDAVEYRENYRDYAHVDNVDT